MKPWQWLLYIFFWSLFVTVIDRHDLATWSEFLIKFISRIIQNTITIIPAFYLIDYLRPVFRHDSFLIVSIRIVLLLMSSAAVSATLVKLTMINIGWL